MAVPDRPSASDHPTALDHPSRVGVGSKPRRTLTATGYYGFLLLGWDGVLLPSLIRSVEHDFGQGDAAFALLYLLTAVLYAVGAFSGGLLVQRWGRRRILLSGAAIPAVGLVIAALTPQWSVFLLAFTLGSWGTGVIDGGVNGLFLDLYSGARGSALNLLHACFAGGALIAPFLLGLLVSAGTGWRPLLLATGAGFLLLAVAVALLPVPHGRHLREPVHPAEPDTVRASDVRDGSLLPFFGLAVGIGFYTAAEIGVSNWLVRLLAAESLVVATAVLSAFWTGLTAGRLLSGWLAEQVEYSRFAAGAFLLASVSLAGAVLSPWLPLSIVLFTLTGMFYGPVFPTIVALGGAIYPTRATALSGGLTTAASVGGIIYPPLMGLLAAGIGLRGGMLGAALLGLPAAGALVAARALSRRPAPAQGT